MVQDEKDGRVAVEERDLGFRSAVYTRQATDRNMPAAGRDAVHILSLIHI